MRFYNYEAFKIQCDYKPRREEDVLTHTTTCITIQTQELCWVFSMQKWLVCRKRLMKRKEERTESGGVNMKGRKGITASFTSFSHYLEETTFTGAESS
jgi:hypothetical protein